RPRWQPRLRPASHRRGPWLGHPAAAVDREDRWAQRVPRQHGERGTGVQAWRCLIDQRTVRINDRIRAREVRVIDEDGSQLGIMPPSQALMLAEEKGLDLVEISATGTPPARGVR